MNSTPLCLLGLTLTLVLSSCKPATTGRTRSRGAATPTPSQIDEFAKLTDLAIPGSAKGLVWRHDVGMDDQIFLKLEIPATDLPAFLTSSGLEKELGNTTNTKAATSYLGKSLSTHPTKFREGQRSLPSGRFLNVLIDQDSPTTAVVYLLWFET